MSRGAAVEDASRGRFPDCAGVCADHRESGAVSVWQADRQLSRSGSGGRFQRGTTTTGTYLETRQLPTAFLAGGSSAGDGALRSEMAQSIFPPGDATRSKDRESSHGAEIGGALVLDVAQRVGLRATGKVRSARGTAWKSPWCAVNHRRNDWARPAPLHRGV